MTDEQRKSCKHIIYAAATAAAGIGLAPLPGADIMPICAIQVSMIIAIARVFDIAITKDLAKTMAETFLLGNVGKQLVEQLAKALPFVGSGVNATIAFALTETLGWEKASEFDIKENRK